ncbi:hypothetical protein AB0M79_22360 [Polymorphospora sp. NPDC051019]|uniref:hypothetical protein n=1 Tax=Polymorphospora sp. NPDC051019 TaxID=3155725 RepID=UPI003449F71C
MTRPPSPTAGHPPAAGYPLAAGQPPAAGHPLAIGRSSTAGRARPGRRGTRFATGAAALAVAAALGTPVAAAAEPTAGPPTIGIDRAEVAVGAQLTVTLTGWPAGLVNIELCGNAGRRGSADCAVTSAVQVAVTGNRPARTRLRVAAPPAACPCVVRATSLDQGTSGTVPLSVTGGTAPAAAPTTETGTVPAAKLVVTELRVSAQPSWSSVFGGSARQLLVATVRNDGTAPAVEPAVSVTLGRGDEPTGFVPPPLLDTIAPGEQRVVRLPFTIPAPAVGRYTVRGEIGGLSQPVVFSATVRNHPWGLPGLGVALAVAWYVRSRRRPLRPAEPVPAGPVDPADGRAGGDPG